MMMPLLTWIVVGQAAVLQPPQTGNATIDTFIWLAGGLLTAMGLREATYWKGKIAEKRSGEAEKRSGHGHDRVLERIAEIQRATLKELEESRRENDKAHERIEDKLADIGRRIGG